MDVLLIEDEAAAADRMVKSLGRHEPEIIPRVVCSRDAALKALKEHSYDLVICDLQIPAEDGALAVAEEHGLQVASVARLVAPGTPVVLLTGFATFQNTREVAAAPLADLYGREDYALVQVFEKRERAACIERVRQHARELVSLQSVDLHFDEDVEDAELALCLRRALSVYARRNGAVQAEVSLLSGLSGAQPGRAAFADTQGAVVATVFFKVGERSKLLDEQSRYRSHVPGSLRVGSFAPEAGSVMFGTRRCGSLFYSLASRHTAPYFLAGDTGPGEGLTRAVFEELSPWHSRRRCRRVRVGDLRSAVISDERLRKEGVDWTFAKQFEEQEVEVQIALQHGDLHGQNILVDAGESPLLIDFGDVREALSVLDAVTLEFSWVFHSGSPLKDDSWPTLEQAECWHDLETYLRGCPVPDSIRACRDYAHDQDPAGLPVTVYVHAMRQLKYRDVPKDLALAAARGAIAAANPAVAVAV